MTKIDQILINLGTNICYFLWMFVVTKIAHSSADYHAVSHFPFLLGFSAAIHGGIFSSTCEWTKADLTQDFLASLKHVKSSPDICIICFDICRIPVRLPCGHIECEACIRLMLDHNFDSCSRCGKKFLRPESCFFRSRCLRSILFAQALVFCAIFTEMTLILHVWAPWHSAEQYKKIKQGQRPISGFIEFCSIIIIIILNNLIARAFRISIRHRRPRWHDLATYSPAAFECIYYLGAYCLAAAWCYYIQC